jgi:hypothetical protein
MPIFLFCSFFVSDSWGRETKPTALIWVEAQEYWDKLLLY